MAFPKVVAFLCEESGVHALRAIREKGLPIPDGVKFVSVPCGGRVDIEFIVKAVREGAGSVLVFGCFDGNCRYKRGNIRVMKRVERVKDILSSLGIRDVEVEFIPVATASYMRMYREIWKRYPVKKEEGIRK